MEKFRVAIGVNEKGECTFEVLDQPESWRGNGKLFTVSNKQSVWSHFAPQIDNSGGLCLRGQYKGNDLLITSAPFTDFRTKPNLLALIDFMEAYGKGEILQGDEEVTITVKKSHLQAVKDFAKTLK